MSRPAGHSSRHRALVLVDADVTSDAAAAKRAGITATTVAGWRRELATDPETAGHYEREWRLFAGRYRAEYAITGIAALRKMRDLIPEATVADMSILQSIATQCGEVVVQADSLVPQKDQDATPIDREGSSDAARPARDRDDSRH